MRTFYLLVRPFRRGGIDSSPLLLPSLPFLFSFSLLPVLGVFFCVFCCLRSDQQLRSPPFLSLRRLVSTIPHLCGAARLPGTFWMCRSGFFETRSTLFYLFRPQTCPPTVLPGTPALHCRQPRSIPTTTRRSVDLMRPHVDLTCRSVSPTCLPLNLAPVPRPPPLLAGCFVVFRFFIFFSVCCFLFWVIVSMYFVA